MGFETSLRQGSGKTQQRPDERRTQGARRADLAEDQTSVVAKPVKPQSGGRKPS